MLQNNWEEEYFFVPNKNGLATCFICQESFIRKKYNINRHYTTKYKSFDDNLSRESLMKREKLTFFKKSLQQQQNVMSVAISQDAVVITATYDILIVS